MDKLEQCLRAIFQEQKVSKNMKEKKKPIKALKTGNNLSLRQP